MKNKRFKSIVSVAIGFMMALSLLPAGVFAAEPTVYFSEDFNGYSDGERPSSFNSSTISYYNKPSNGVVTVSEGNKALWFGRRMIEASYGFTNSSGFDTQDQKKFVFSASFMAGENPLDMIITIAGTSGNTFIPYSIRGGTVYAKGTTKAGTVVSNKFTKVDVVMDFAKDYFTLFIDGKNAGQYFISSTINAPLKTILFRPSNMTGEEDMYVDDVRLYSGNEIIEFPKGAFNPDCPEILDYTLFNVNYALFNQKNLYNGTNGNNPPRYPTNFAMTANGATSSSGYALDNDYFTVNRFDWDNPYRENDYITMRKEGTSLSQIYIGETGASRSIYYYIEAKLSSENLPSQAEAFKLYSYYINDGVYATLNQPVINISGSGEVTTARGVKLGKISKGTFLDIAVAADYNKKTIDVYVDGELKDAGIPIDARATDFYRFYFIIPAASSEGELIFDGMMFERLNSPYSPDGSHDKSVYPENAEYEKYLNGKYAVSGFGGTYYANGQKKKLPAYFFDKEHTDFENVYLTRETLAEMFGIEAADIAAEAGSSAVRYQGGDYDVGTAAVEQDGQTLISFGPFAEKVLGMHVLYYPDMGLVLADEEPIGINPDNERLVYDITYNDGLDTPLMALGKYMIFDRPDAQTLKEDFFTVNAGKEDVHPRIGITQERIEELKVLRTQDEILDTMIKRQIAYADSNLNVVPVYDLDRTIRGHNSTTFLPLSLRIEAFSCAYWFTGEQKYVDAAYRQFEEIARWQDWNECHEIDTGRILTAMAFLYDWCYHGLTEEQRDEIVAVTTHLAILPTYEYVTGQSGHPISWLYYMSNYNAMCSAGPITFLAAIAERADDIVWEVGAQALRGTEYFLQSMMPDGAAGDSPSYWKEHMFPGIAYVSLQDLFGGTYGVTSSPGLEKTTSWIISMMHPAGQYNFHDTPGYTTVNTKFFTVQAMGLFANLFDNPNWYAYRKYLLEQENYASLYTYDIISYMEGGDIDFVPLDVFTEGMQTFSAKGSITDINSLFLAAHGGSENGFHAHEDVGTFIYLNNGIGWAVEPGTEDYFLRSAQGNLPMYLDRLEGHNGIVFNPSPENFRKAVGSTVRNQRAEVLDYVSKDRGSYIVYDLTGPYSNNTDSYVRGISTADDRRSAVIRDEFTVKEPGTVGYWFMHTEADEFEVIDKNTILMKKDGEEQIVELYTDLTDYEFYVTEAATLYPEITTNDRDVSKTYEKLAIRFTSDGTNYIHVKMYDPSEPGLGEADKMNRTFSEWSVPDGALPEREAFGYINYTTDDGITSTLKKIVSPEGAERPKITSVNLVDKTQDYEVLYEEDRAVIRIYSSKNPGTYRDIGIAYVVGEPVRTLDMYPEGTFTEYPIVSASEEATHSASVSIDWIADGDYATRWGCSNIGDYAILDLGEIRSITHFAAAQWEGASRTFYYQVLVSADGVNYTPVKDVTTSGEIDGAEGTCEVWEIAPVDARYVKILNTGGNSSTNAQNIYEFKVLKRN